MSTIDRRTLAALAAPSLPLAALTLPLVTYVPEHYGNALGMNLGTLGLIFMIVRLLDIGFNPVIGGLMDRTRTRWGRFRPWLVIGAPLVMIGTALLFFARPGVGPAYLFVALIVTYAGFSVVTLAQLALSAAMSFSYHVRSRVFAWWQAAFTAGIIIVLLLPTLVGARLGLGIVPLMGTSVLVLTPLAIAFAVLGVRDTGRPAERPRANPKAYLLLFRRATVRRLIGAELLLGLVSGITAAGGVIFAMAVKDFSLVQYGTAALFYFIVAIASSPVWGWLANRLEKHRALTVASAIYVVFMVTMWIVPPGRFELFLAGNAIGGFAFTASSLLPRAMLADIADEERLDTGEDRTGLLYAVLTGTYKVGQAVSVGLVFLLLDAAGYDAKAGPANGASAILSVKLIYCLLPLLCAAGAGSLMIGYPLTARRHAEIRAALGEADRPASAA